MQMTPIGTVHSPRDEPIGHMRTAPHAIMPVPEPRR